MGNIVDKYSKEELQAMVATSHNFSELLLKLGYSTKSGNNRHIVKRRLNEYNISTDHFTMSNKIDFKESQVFIKDSPVSQNTLRRRYKKTGIEYKCAICGQSPIWNNQELTLILDHKDGDKHNNTLNNIRWVCPNCNQQLWSTGYKGVKKYDEYGQKITEHNKCHMCGKIIPNGKCYCSDCNRIIRQQKHIQKQETVKNYIEHNGLTITKEELEKMIQIYPFVYIGNKYGVTDNAVRKWCKKMDLPYRKRDIKSRSKYDMETKP